ncbi:hypothetical protein [Kutzneria kofuensis]|uniref:hypothetical protein n=1 Tax=Kutzneria kofuensis TaxID=103725 RepID=UPI0031E6E8FE
MTITVLETYPAMRAILRAPGADRPELLRAMLEPAAGMYRYFRARSTSSRCTG